MVGISGEILLVNKHVVICIQLPEFAINHVEMFI